MIKKINNLKIFTASFVTFLIVVSLLIGCKTSAGQNENINSEISADPEIEKTQEPEEENLEEGSIIETETVNTAIPLMDESIVDYISSLDLDLHKRWMTY